MKSLGIDRLGVEERLALVEEIWDSIAADSSTIPLTDAQRDELARRYEEDEAHPNDITPWEDVKAATLSSLEKGADVKAAGNSGNIMAKIGRFP